MKEGHTARDGHVMVAEVEGEEGLTGMQEAFLL